MSTAAAEVCARPGCAAVLGAVRVVLGDGRAVCPPCYEDGGRWLKTPPAVTAALREGARARRA